jgi:hypothetical protein
MIKNKFNTVYPRYEVTFRSFGGAKKMQLIVITVANALRNACIKKYANFLFS